MNSIKRTISPWTTAMYIRASGSVIGFSNNAKHADNLQMCMFGEWK